jgi:2-oxoglutarate ferredoxin oxidoreductase subunit alpha
MKEPLVKEQKNKEKEQPKKWALTGAAGRKPNRLKSLYLQDGELTEHNWKLFKKYQKISEKEVLVETRNLDDAKLAVVAFGSMARIAKTAVEEGREKGLRLGFIRPITVFPFPGKALLDASRKIKKFLAVELNTGQMVEDVSLSVAGDAKVHFYGRPPGSIPSPDEILEEIEKVYSAARGQGSAISKTKKRAR